MEPSASQLSAPGRSAIAVIQVCGPLEVLDAAISPFFRAVSGRRLADLEFNRIRFGLWGTDFVEEVVVCRVSECAVEINCHGGIAAVDRILKNLESAGIPTVTWQKQMCQTRSALGVECYEALTRTTTTQTAVLVLAQEQGRLEAAVDEIRQRAATRDWTTLAKRAESLLEWGEFGCHLSEAWRVVIVGRPNVGKSTLLNALLGFRRAIVFDEPGTTRDVVQSETAFDGWPVVLADTAGLRETTDPLEAEGVRRARRVLSESDCRCFVFDLSQPCTSADRELLAQAMADERALVVGNKSDLARQWDADWPDSAIQISASQSTGIEELIRRVAAMLVPHMPPSDAVMPVTRRQWQCLQRCHAAVAQRDARQLDHAVSQLISGRFDFT